MDDYNKRCTRYPEMALQVAQRHRQLARDCGFSDVKKSYEATAKEYEQRASDILSGKIPSDDRGAALDGWDTPRKTYY
jgi:hypothetical protein